MSCFADASESESPRGSLNHHDVLTSPSGLIKCVVMLSLTKKRWLFMTMFDGGSWVAPLSEDQMVICWPGSTLTVRWNLN